MSTKINTQWFKDRLRERDLSMRRLAKLMEVDPSAVSLMLRGKRQMSQREAAKISGLLTLPVTEVMRQAGVSVVEDTRALPLRATVDANGKLREVTTKQPRRLNAPHDVPSTGLVCQIRSTELTTDGWIMFCGTFDSRVEAFIDRLGVFDLKREGHVLGTLKRGYENEKFNLVPYTGAPTLQNIEPKSVASVLWIRPV